jgi:guanylate kinase
VSEEISMSELEFNLPKTQPFVIVISGPSGVGKDTVIQRMKERNLPFQFVVTATSRPPRQNEVHGKDYFFYSREEFVEMIDKGELLEHALVYNDYKGIPKSQVQDALASGKDVVMRLDVQGADTIRKLCPDALLIFLSSQDEKEMVDRLQERKTETSDDLKLRIATARQEMNHINSFDYVVINREYHLDETVDTIVSIIIAEHHRVKPRKVTL